MVLEPLERAKLGLGCLLLGYQRLYMGTSSKRGRGWGVGWRVCVWGVGASC